MVIEESREVSGAAWVGVLTNRWTNWVNGNERFYRARLEGKVVTP
jgi:hypothetical protein